MSVVKPTLPSHHGLVNNHFETFTSAYAFLERNNGKQFLTTGNQAPFFAIPAIAKKGLHKGQRVIRYFNSQGSERARAYEDCWGHKTNCNRTYIDCYTKAIQP
ncbi:MAG: hypothetical protein GX070_11765 [Alcaligenaceae bacterium]|nr:hypothetical protein [Alcaligenaceae bacterium]